MTDVLNEALLQQKFLLIRRHTSFFTHPVDEKLNVPDLPLVTLSDLSKRGKTEIVQAILPLKGTILVEDVAPEMDKFITKFGRVVPFPRTNTLLIQDTAGNVLRIMETLERVEVGGGGETLSHPCKYARARDVVTSNLTGNRGIA